MSDVKPVAWQRFDEIGEYDSYMGSVEEGDYVKYDDALTTVTALQAEIEALRKDAERYENALEQLRQWAQAYPLEVFPEPDFKKTHEVLTANGMTLDAISAFNMRHVITKVIEIIDAAIAKEKQQENLK